jgi:hypothetical protein
MGIIIEVVSRSALDSMRPFPWKAKLIPNKRSTSKKAPIKALKKAVEVEEVKGVIIY